MKTAVSIAAKGFAAFALLALAACDNEPDIEDQSIEPAAPGEETLPIESPSEPVYVGVWAADEDWCGVAPGTVDPSPIAISENEFIGYENRCRLGDVQEGTEGGYQIALVCEGEGVEYTETVDLDVDGEMLRMTREGGVETLFVRCEGEDQE